MESIELAEQAMMPAAPGPWGVPGAGLKHGNGSNGNGTDSADGDLEGLQEWQVISIAAVSAAGLVLLTVIALMWKYCKIKPSLPTVHTKTIGPATNVPEAFKENKKSHWNCCPSFNTSPISVMHTRTSARPATQSDMEKNENGQLSGKQETAQVESFFTRPPLPPIRDDTVNMDETGSGEEDGNSMPHQADPQSIQGEQGRPMPPRRLAPLNDHGKITATTLAGGTMVIRRASSIGPIKQNMELRPLSSPASKMMNQKRFTPTPAPLGD